MKIKLIQFPKARKVPSLSPFCMKLETYFLLANVTYESVETMNFRAAPKKKMPYIQLDGERIGDSTLIIDKLVAMNSAWDLDRDLTADQKAQSVVVQRMLEDNLMHCLFHMRWCDLEGWKNFSPVVFHGAPKLIKHLVGAKLHKQANKTSKILGVGAHTREEILAIADKDLNAISLLLGDRNFYFGESPHMLDCVLFGVLGQLTLSEQPQSLAIVASKYENLKNYSQRMMALYQRKLKERSN